MFKTVNQELENYKNVWATNEGFAEVVTDFKAYLSGIEETRGPANTSTTGITEDKNAIRDELIDSIMEISGPFVTMASRMGNNNLKSKVAYTDSELEGMTEGELVKTGKELAALAVQYKDTLVKYDVSDSDIDQLKQLADGYGIKIAEPRGAVTERMSANEKLNLLFAQTSTLLKEQLDGMVDKYRRKHTDLWNAYFNARKLVDYGIRHDKKQETKK